MAGYCRNAKHCLNIHDPILRDNALKKEYTAHTKVVVHQTLDFLNETPKDDVVCQPKRQLTQEEYHRQLGAENLYYYGDVPVSEKSQSSLAPDYSKVIVAHSVPVVVVEKPKPQPTCRFFQRGQCRNGDSCSFSHHVANTSFDPHAEITKFEKMASASLECGICLEVISRNGSGQFGLLTSCDHAFCLPCIRNWRSSDMSNSDDTKSLVRRCPLCREASYLVVPCDRMVRDKERKMKLVQDYIRHMGTIHCAHFNNGEGTCPFGTSCFYIHMYSNGKLQDPGELRVFKDADGKAKFDHASKLSEYFDTMHQSQRRR